MSKDGCVQVYADAAYPQMDVEMMVSLRTQRHLEDTLQTKLIAAGGVFTGSIIAAF